MSSFKNAIQRRPYKERAQPHSRSKYGILEKHKDYVVRARNYQQKEQAKKKLLEKAAFKNPDEFYFKMIKTQTVDGVHRPGIEANKYSKEELMLMKTQDIGYILQKLQSEKKKIEKLTSALHSTDNLSSSKHIYYAEDREEAKEIQGTVPKQEKLSFFEDLPKDITRKMEISYKELKVRQGRVKELEKIYMDMAMQKELQKKGRKRKLREDEVVAPTSRPVYKWRQERKR